MLCIVLVSFLTGCATTGSLPGDKDPYENFNRSVLDFNLKSDRLILKPIAKTYSRIIPKPVRNGVNNFFSNLWEPMTVVNDLLQGKFHHAARDTTRFIINSTIGVLGIFDVATEMDLPKHREDFGQTLAVWGVPSGPYLVLPLLGPSNLRDTAGLIPQFVYLDAVTQMNNPESYYAGGLRLVDARSLLLGADEIFDVQPDKYLFLREAYRQLRADLIADGKTTDLEGESSEDDLIDQLLEDD